MLMRMLGRSTSAQLREHTSSPRTYVSGSIGSSRKGEPKRALCLSSEFDFGTSGLADAYCDYITFSCETLAFETWNKSFIRLKGVG